MAGFVDPFFKHINPLEPNFFVCNISWDNVQPVKKERFYTFFNKNSYIVYSASRIRNVTGNSFKGPSQKIEIHIHLWLGSEASSYSVELGVNKLQELDDLLEGAAILHWEVQGYESNRFLSYFKTSGFVIKRGDANVVIVHLNFLPMEQTKSELYTLSEKSSTLILTEQSEILEGYPVHIFRAKNKIFIWTRNEASTEDLYSALKFAEAAERNGISEKIVWVSCDPKRKYETSKEDSEDFYNILASTQKRCDKTSSTQEFTLSQTKSRGNIKLYKLTFDEEESRVSQVKNAPLSQSDLYEMDACIIDHYANGIWIWLSRKFSEKKRNLALKLAESYALSTECNTPASRNTSKTRVIQGKEPTDFKFLFNSWIDDFVIGGEHYFSKKVVEAVNAGTTSDRLEEFPFLAAKAQVLDYGTGIMTIVRVNDSKLEPLQPKEFGIFNSKFSYLVHYRYTVGGVTKDVLYYWLGAKAPKREQECSIWPCLKDIPEFKDTRVLVRLQQHLETPHFYVLFQGKMVILDIAPLSSGRNNHLDEYNVVLLKVTGGDMCNAYSIQVEPHAYSLNSYNVYILRASNISFIWYGLRSRGDEREMARRTANKWCPNYTVILEGQENKDFWSLLGGSQSYSSEECALTPSINVPPRIYKCTMIDNDLLVTEIVDFVQSDLGCRDTILLDAWNVLFIWSGRDVPEEEKLKNELIAQKYITSDPSFRKSGLPITQVQQDHEPPTFTGFFPSWSKTGLTCNEDLKKKVLATYIDQNIDSEVEVRETVNKKEETEGVSAIPTATHNSTNLISTHTYPLHCLQDKVVEELPPGVDPDFREDYLTDEDFYKAFSVSRAMFKKLPMWKRKNLKVVAKLF